MLIKHIFKFAKKKMSGVDQLQINIDIREHSLLQEINHLVSTNPTSSWATNHNIISSQLPVGDIIIQTMVPEELLVIERKSIVDLLASIKDGRYEEQSVRLGSTVHLPRHNIIYLIEDVAGKRYSDQETTLLYSSMFSILYAKGFSVLRSKSVKETAEMILRFTHKLRSNMAQGKTPYYRLSLPDTTMDSGPTDNNYVDVIKRVKKDNITPENIATIMLCQIPGFSTASAQCVANKFDNKLSVLITSLQSSPTCLDDLYLENGDKKRKISQSNKDALYNYFGVPKPPPPILVKAPRKNAKKTILSDTDVNSVVT